MVNKEVNKIAKTTVPCSFLQDYMSNNILHVHPTQNAKANPQDLRDHDDYQDDDAHPEGGVMEDVGTYDDELPDDKLSQELLEEMSGEIDEAQLQKAVDAMMRQRCNSGQEHQYHVDQMQNYLKSDIVWESMKERLTLLTPKKKALVVHSCQRDPKAPPMTLLNQDLFYLKHGNSCLKKYILSLHKYHVVHFPMMILKNELQDGQKHLRDNPHEVYSESKILEIIITTYELGYEHKFITKIIVRRANEKIDPITEPDYKNLNKNDIEDMYLLCINDKERVHDIQLGMKSYQQKVNLTAPTITFLSIEKEELFTITSEPVVGMIYENNKKEKRVMIHKEIHKFCDATLKRVLKGLEKYNKDVKYGYADPSPSDVNAKYLQFYKEDIREDSSGFRIYNRKTRKIMEMIHVKFDELTTMVTECNSLEPDSNRSLFDDSSVEPSHTPSKEELDDFFGPISSSTIIIVHADEAPHVVSTSEEQSPPKSNDIADEPNQEDNVELDGNTFFSPFYTPVSKEVGSP
ncbi:hypothetical protein Tco_0894949 [Tanacetum coccineum]|uniref:Uncharacterized protein n=1 Tax=Tanacetum coccineum TaxID=301880 RepID=A0ABQ5CEN0_9ASTR